MPKIQIKQIEMNSDDLSVGTKYYDPSAGGSLEEQVRNTIKNKAIYRVLKQGQYKNHWLPSNESFDIPGLSTLPASEFVDFYLPAWGSSGSPGLKDNITFVEKELKTIPDVATGSEIEFVTIRAVVIFESSDEIYNFVTQNYQKYITKGEEVEEDPAPVDEPDPTQGLPSPPTGPTHKVHLSDSSAFLALRDLPSRESLPGLDIYTSDKKGSLSQKYPTQAGSLGGLVGLLPHGTEVMVLTPGMGGGNSWDQVKIITGPAELINKVAYVDNVGLKQISEQLTGGELIDSISTSATLTEEQLADVALVTEHINPPIIETSTDEADNVNPYVDNIAPKQDWTKRTPLEVFRNTEEQRYEVVVELDFLPEVAFTMEGTEDPSGYREAKKNEARKEGLRTILRYFNRRSDDAYLLPLLTAGTGEMSELNGFWADDNPSNRKIYYLVTTPYTGAGGFNYKSHKPAETLTIEEMVVERVIDFQYAFTTNKIEKNVNTIIDILKNKIKPGIDNYNGAIENSPDVEYQIKKLEQVVPAIKELFAENNVKFRSDKEDQVEFGLDTDLNVVYVRFGPEDGKDGAWRLR